MRGHTEENLLLTTNPITSDLLVGSEKDPEEDKDKSQYPQVDHLNASMTSMLSNLGHILSETEDYETANERATLEMLEWERSQKKHRQEKRQEPERSSFRRKNSIIKKGVDFSDANTEETKPLRDGLNPDLHTGSHGHLTPPLSDLFRANSAVLEFKKLPLDDEASTETVIVVPKNITAQVMAAVSVSLGSMIVGFASAYTSPALASMKEPESRLQITMQEESWIGSLMPLSALIGGILGGPLVERAGRKTTLLITGLPFILSWLLIAFAQNVWMIYVGRAISGWCVGVCSLCLPVYLSETVQAEVRGTLGLMPTTVGNIGILLCFIAGSYVDWTVLAMIGAILPIPFIIFTMLIPETPRWYVSQGKHKQAREALQWLRDKSTDIGPELTEIEKMHIISTKNGAKWNDLFIKAHRKPLIVSLGLMAAQQLSGINAVIFYTVSIFKIAGSSIDGNLSTIIVGIVNFGAVFLANLLIDRVGRKVLLYISETFMIIGLGVLGGFFYVKEETSFDVSYLGWLPLASFIIFVTAFSLGMGPIPWLMMGEIFPGRIRGNAAAMATSFNWTCTFAVTKAFSDMILYMGPYGTFWFFAVVLILGLIFTIAYVPETRGQSLEDIEKNLTRPFRRVSSIANLKPLPTPF